MSANLIYILLVMNTLTSCVLMIKAKGVNQTFTRPQLMSNHSIMVLYTKIMKLNSQTHKPGIVLQVRQNIIMLEVES